MITKYERSKDELYPTVYHTFKARSRISEELVDYYIQDLTQNHADEAVELIFKYFTPDEAFQKAAKYDGNEDCLKYLRQFYKKKFEERVSLACFISGSNEMVGLNVLSVHTKGIQSKLSYVSILIVQIWTYLHLYQTFRLT